MTVSNKSDLAERVAILEEEVATLKEQVAGLAATADPGQQPAPAAPGGEFGMIDILRDLDNVARTTDAAIRQLEGGDALLLLEDSQDAEDDPSGLDGLRHAFDVLSALMTRIREMDADSGAGADEEALRKAESERDAALKRVEGAESELDGCKDALQAAKSALEASQDECGRLGRDLEGRTRSLQTAKSELDGCKAALQEAKTSLEASQDECGRLERDLEERTRDLQKTESELSDCREKLRAAESDRDDQRNRADDAEAERNREKARAEAAEARLLPDAEQNRLMGIRRFLDGLSSETRDLLRRHFSNGDVADLLIRAGDFGRLGRFWNACGEPVKEGGPCPADLAGCLEWLLGLYNAGADPKAEAVSAAAGDRYDFERQCRVGSDGSTVAALLLPGLRNPAGKLLHKTLVKLR